MNLVPALGSRLALACYTPSVLADPGRPEHLAETIGDRPLLLLAGLAALTLVLSLATMATVRWADRRGIAWSTRLVRAGREHASPRTRRLITRVPALRYLWSVEYLVIHLVLGLVFAIGTLLFFVLADQVGERGRLTAFDVALSRALHASARPDVTAPLITITNIGNSVGLTIATVVVAIGLFAARRYILAVGWLVAGIGTGILNSALKAVYQRHRPVFPDPLVHAGGWSFPSGHAMGSFVLTGMLVYIGAHWVRTTRGRLCLLCAAMLWTVTIGYTRIYLGAHYLTDVIAGYAAGGVWLAACISCVEVATARWSAARPSSVAPSHSADVSPTGAALEETGKQPGAEE